ncbi:MAG: HTH domain-containing protein [Bifidobacterium sp.]|nr:HTH domain-containing protein [Bifidobacterium sp.]
MTTFSPEEVEYLRSLPAVESVSPRRIVYTDRFKRACVLGYLEGDSPTRMFRDARLDPAILGYRRIEGAIARWKRSVTPEDLARADMAELATLPAPVAEAARPIVNRLEHRIDDLESEMRELNEKVTELAEEEAALRH